LAKKPTPKSIRRIERQGAE